jgi:hypothetical protein
VRVQIRRGAAGAGAESKLTLEVGTPDVVSRSQELPSTLIGADGHLRVRLEVHNVTTAGVRVLLWNNVQSFEGETAVTRPFVDAGNADFDSRELRWIFATHGRGALWGLELSGMRVLSAYREAPYAL